jgi:hypothetical protein
MHTESEGAADQRNNEKEYRSQVDERRREMQRAAQEEGKPELTEADFEDDLQVLGREGVCVAGCSSPPSPASLPACRPAAAAAAQPV